MRNAATSLALLGALFFGAPAAIAQEGHTAEGHDTHEAPAHGEAHGDAHAGGHEAGGHGGGHHDAPFNFADFSNETTKPFLYSLVNFGILVAIYYSLGKKPIAEALKLRRAAVAKEIEEAQRMKHEAEERAKQYQAKLASLEGELELTKKALVEAGKGERDRIVKEAQEKAERMTKDAVFLLEQELKQTRQDLVKETVEIAMTTAEELLKSKITAADQERLADEYLADMIAKNPKTSIPAAGGTT